ncbi:HupE/UreJ family protein [Sinorhizobium meliloti]|uniref:HupE/UreJ family protein n=1 Tax=Rhizobium meliloti TaxID=382 RepID=A0A2J0YTZ0_RHIML|nr:HupE/UreJ family protein [Sinorhizobium meliloti]PJR09874.1 hypothetical protein CEJ86_30125 [Sinorhizobium meliloti]
MRTGAIVATAALTASLLGTEAALAHGVTGGDAAFMSAAAGWNIGPYLYLGAKHMVTGYDHLLFLLGVIFFLYRMKDVALYVTMFSIGHSITLLTGVLSHIWLSPYLVDAIIGFSVVYKAFDNLGGFRTWFGVEPDQRLAVFGFGLVHGFGLATKLQDLQLSADGLVPNMLAFNVGVELGQITALGAILLVMSWWRSWPLFQRTAAAANVLLMAAGFILIEYQLVGYFTETTS